MATAAMPSSTGTTAGGVPAVGGSSGSGSIGSSVGSGGGGSGGGGAASAAGTTIVVSPSVLHIIGVPLLVLAAVAVGFVLVYLKEILVPFVISVFFVYLLRPLVNWLTRPCAQCCCCAAGAALSRVASGGSAAALISAAGSSSRGNRRARNDRKDHVERYDEVNEGVGLLRVNDNGSGSVGGSSGGMSPTAGGDLLPDAAEMVVLGGANSGRDTIDDDSVTATSVPGSATLQRRLVSVGSNPASPHEVEPDRSESHARHRTKSGDMLLEPAAACWRCRISRCPRWLAVVLALCVAFGVLSGLVLLVADAIQTFEQTSLLLYQDNAIRVADNLISWVQVVFHIDAKFILHLVQTSVPLASILQGTLVVLIDTIGNTFLIMLLVLYLLFEQGEHPANSLRGKIDNQIQRYLVIKTLISGIVGLIVYIILGPILNVNMAHLFGVLTFFLNYIPNVGPIIATVLPIPIVVFDPDMPTTAMVLAFLLPGFVHMIIGNFLEPKWFGRSLELHPVVVLMSLGIWFAIWGVTGAILSIPMTAVIRIILSHIKHPYAIIMLRLLEGHIGLPEFMTSGSSLGTVRLHVVGEHDRRPQDHHRHPHHDTV